MKMRYILGLLLLPVIAIAQTTTPLINKTTKVWVSPTAAEIATANFYGLTTNPLSQFAATTSLQLKNNISDETGSGSLVFGTSPALVTPDIGAATGASLSLTGTLTVQNGATSGVIRLGADVNATTLTSNTRKLGAFVFPRYGSSTEYVEAITWDSTAGSSASILFLGGRVGGSGRSAQNGYISANSSETSTGATQVAGWDATSFYFGTASGKLRWSHSDDNADRIIFWDDSAGGYVGLTLSGMTISGTTLSVDAASESAAGKLEISTQAEAEAKTNDTTAMTPLKVAQQIANIPRLLYYETQVSGTAGGTFTSGAWQTRTLNTEIYDPEGIGSLSSNQITLPTGTYVVRWLAPAYLCGRHQSRLYNVTDAAVESYGMTARSDAGGTQTVSSGVWFLIVSGGSKAYRIEHRCETTAATQGFGTAGSFGGEEIFTTVDIQKID